MINSKSKMVSLSFHISFLRYTTMNCILLYVLAYLCAYSSLAHCYNYVKFIALFGFHSVVVRCSVLLHVWYALLLSLPYVHSFSNFFAHPKIPQDKVWIFYVWMIILQKERLPISLSLTSIINPLFLQTI